MPLTKRQKEILGFLKEYLGERGYSPTLEEIANHFKIASLNAIYKHLKALEERGFIRRLSNQARSIKVLENSAPNLLPLLGQVAAGQPIEAVRDVEGISVPESFLTNGNNYVLRVTGDSMIDEHIQDGDLVVVEERDHATDGEMVVALVDGESVTLKKYFREGEKIRLQPANQAMDPILVREDSLKIQGVVVGVMRRY
jgi:repressor LexA